MFNLLHTFNPSPILFSIGPINIHWYGFFIVIGILAATTLAIHLAKLHGIKSEVIVDLTVWLIVSGIIGARVYDIFLELPYFLNHPMDIIKIWQGGLAIHGAIIGGGIALYLFTKKYKNNLWQLAAVIITVLPLAQAIGRWGNYFNQELFGYPTNLPWGIPISPAHRPWQYLDYGYFHPAFLYESAGNLLIFMVLFSLHHYLIKKNKTTNSTYVSLLAAYLLLYSSLRFSIEYIRIDATPLMLGLRFPQIVSLLIISLCISYFILNIWLKNRNNRALDN